ncbi:hypothetical protein BVC80_9085g26 [Macleaya cordata]|uniref:Reverse transcriptase zinc-binding domain n=1 Tax=Macleaya cordata TaxID=56857 RepID=A0A200PR01_MACCD|nr:hypothetical protein BVC80_9085g26 [Macleaya cordata]
MLDIYSLWSGQVINYDKSSIHFSPKVDKDECDSLAAILGVQRMRMSDKYLGHYLLLPKSRIVSFDGLISKIPTRLKGWKRDNLSHAGCLQLIQSTLASIPIYYMAAYLLPKGVLEKILCIQRNFWWKKSEERHRLIFTAWSKFYKPKEDGGLGIQTPEKVNVSLVMKMAWRFLTQPQALWCQLLSAKYLRTESYWTEKKYWNSSPIWSSLCSVRNYMKEGTCWCVGDGHKIKIWTDPWVPNLPGFRVSGISDAGIKI